MRAAFTSGRFWAWVHGVGAVVWVGLCWPGMTVWRNSVPFIVFVSLYAIVVTHVGGFVAAVSARKADEHDPL